MKWSKRPKSLTKKGEFGPYALPISGQFPKETLGASWHWQVGINPRQVSAIAVWDRVGPQSRDPHLLSSKHFIHSRKHTVELVKCSRKSVRLENKELELQASLPCPEEFWMSPQDEKLLLNHTKTPGFLASRGEEFNQGPEMRLDCSELCVIKFHESIKEIEKASDIGIRRGQKENPLASVSNGVIYSSMNPKNVWRL